MSSIRLRLLKWLVGPILLINLAGASLTYLLAWTPAQVAFDQGLADSAAALAARLRAAAPVGGRVPLPADARQLLNSSGDDATYFAVRAADGRLLAGDADFPPLRPASAIGTAPAYDAAMRGEPVRVVALAALAGAEPVTVGVAQTLRKRREVRSAILRSLVLLEAVFTLVLGALVWLSVTNGLQPLARLRANLNARDGADLAPIAGAEVPYELEPVVGAFNDLLGKVQAGASAQRAFLADMAHQLRTPLAGLKLQLEWLGARHADDPETVRSLGLMRVANERMIRQTNQLLALARATPESRAGARLAPLDLAALVQESIQYFVEEAGRKGVDIGFELEPTIVAGEAFLLRDLVDNLVDNAVRYTPPGGSVTVRCHPCPGGALLAVEDTGPGIPPHQRSQVFQRFVRLDQASTGTGLGLAIVQEIASAHRARIELGAMPDGPGLRVLVRFPGAAAQSPDV